MRKIRALSLVVAMAVVGAGVTACSEGVTPSGETESRTLTMALDIVPTTLDPHYGTQKVVTKISRNIFEPLITTDGDGNPAPMLASWEVESPTETLFTLRDGLIFHDGSEVTTEDVVASMERWTLTSSQGKSTFPGATWTAIDTKSVKLTLAKPTATALLVLGFAGTMMPAIMPKAILDKFADEPVEEFIGTGPYKFVEYVADQHVTLSANEEYAPAPGPTDGLAGDRTPHMQEVIYQFVQDQSSLVMGLETGLYDVAIDVPLDSVGRLRQDENIELKSYDVENIIINLNKKTGLFTDVRARHALELAVDKEEALIAAATDPEFYNFTHQVASDELAEVWGSDVGKDKLGLIDPIEAKRLFEQAGYKEGDKLRAYVAIEYTAVYNAMIVVQQQLAEIGVTLELDIVDFPTYVEVTDDPTDDWDMSATSFANKSDPTSATYLNKDRAGWPEGEEMDEVFANIRDAASLEEAQATYDGFQSWFYSYQPVVKIGDVKGVVGYSSDYTNVYGADGSVVAWAIKPVEK